MVFNLSFPDSTGLYFLIPAVIVQMVIPTEELVISTGTQTNEANAKIKTQPPGTVEAIINTFST